MKTKNILLLLAFMISGCNSNSKLSISQDFEQVAGWYDTSKIKKGKAHSGLYYTETGENNEYSQTYISTLGEISDKAIRRIDMGAWVRLSDPSAKARLVLSIEAGDSSVFWQAIDTEGMSLKAGEWSRLFFTYDLPDGFQPNYVIKMFLWNTSGKNIDADDFDLHFYLK